MAVAVLGMGHGEHCRVVGLKVKKFENLILAPNFKLNF